MKFSTLFRLFAATAFSCLLAISIAAQNPSATGTTTIDYNENTNTVTAHSETQLDYDMSGFTERMLR